MELLKTVKRRTFWSELVYYVLNIGLAVALLVIAQAFQTPFPALALVVLSKWRIIAVRPRFWWANIQANLVDLTVGIGVVGLMYLPTSVFYFRVALAILYAIWLVVIKPMSKRWQVAMQSLIAISYTAMTKNKRFYFRQSGDSSLLSWAGCRIIGLTVTESRYLAAFHRLQ